MADVSRPHEAANESPPERTNEPSPGAASGNSSRPRVWVVLTTHNASQTLEALTRRIFAAMPDGRILVVDAASRDGTGLIADTLAAADSRIQVLHRDARDGIAPAYLAGFAAAVARRADIVVQMDADGSHDPAALWQLILPIAAGRADLVIGSRYMAGSTLLDWGWRRRLISRAGSIYARVVLGLPVQDLTGGYQAWRSSTLAAIDAEGLRARSFVFRIEMTSRAVDAGARVTEVPIVFHDRRHGHSRLGSRVVREACLLVPRLGLERRARRGPVGAPVP